MRELSMLEIENVTGGETTVTSTVSIGIYTHSVSGTQAEVNSYWAGVAASMASYGAFGPGPMIYMTGRNSGWW